MRFNFFRPAMTITAMVSAAGILAGGLALRPALADGGSFRMGPFMIVTCNSASPCQMYNNKGAGPGVTGKSLNGTGVNGLSTGGNGVNGTSTHGDGITGNSTYANGVSAYSSQGVGLYASSSNLAGVWADGGGTAPGLHAYSLGGDGIDAYAGGGNGFAIYALGGTSDAINATASTLTGYAVRGDNSNGIGTEASGTSIGAVVRAPAGPYQYPLDATDSNGNTLMFIDGNGSIFYHGSLIQFAKTHGGNVAATFGSTAASPTVEDHGTARLIGGTAVVQLDPTFSHTIDLHSAYQVMLTPDGDTRGLYVASKSPTSFVVREVQGGRGTISFDYHIYATSLGHAGERATEMTPGMAAARLPHAPIIPERAPTTKKPIQVH
jgi:hypothetical protein